MIFRRILIIQTAFIGDVVLATPILEKLKARYPNAEIDFLLRKGNESLLRDDHRIHELLIWDKEKSKIRELIRIIRLARSKKYDILINVQRFASTGLITWLSGAKRKVGFDKNPFSFTYDRKVSHIIGDGIHEVDRNISLIDDLVETGRIRPNLKIGSETERTIAEYKQGEYITIAPTSVWYTKQYPAHKWVDFLTKSTFSGLIYLLGGPGDFEACDEIRDAVNKSQIINLCSKLDLLQAVALMKGARMNYVNDSAPLHFASAVNAPVTAMFCSTIPEFGFGPLSDDSTIREVNDLDCRPCGLHGYRKCPKGHFDCAEKLDMRD